MLQTDRDALTCDMAETYQIYDWRALPVKTLATLACGLREDSRIKLALTGLSYIPPFVTLIHLHDMFARLLYGPDNMPVNLSKIITKEKSQEAVGYSTAEEFDAARARFLKD